MKVLLSGGQFFAVKVNRFKRDIRIMLMLKHSHIVCLISIKKLTVYQYDGTILTESLSFPANDFGRAEFEIFLDSNQHGIFHFLLDLPDEQFINEKLPHRMSVIDQRNYGERKLMQLLPNSTFRRLRWSKSKENKQKMLLLAGVMNAEPINFWCEMIDDYAIRLGSIGTISLLAHALIRRLKLQQKNLILAHTASDHTLRFTYLQDGHILLSRINLTEQENDSLDRILMREINKIFNYLSSIRAISHNERVTLLVLTDTMLTPESLQSVQFNERVDLSLLSLDDVAHLAKIPKKLDHTNDLFANLTALAGFQNHYAPIMLRRFYFQLRIRQALWISSFLGLLLAIGGGIIELNAQRNTEQQIQYHEQHIKQTLINAETIRPDTEPNDALPLDQRAIVENIHTIRYNWSTPSLSLKILQELIQDSRYLELAHIDWRAQDGEVFAKHKKISVGEIVPEEAQPAESHSSETSHIPTMLNQPLSSEVVAKFRVTHPNIPYRYFLNWIEKTERRLQNTDILVIDKQFPINLSNDATLTAQADQPMPQDALFTLTFLIPPPPAHDLMQETSE